MVLQFILHWFCTPQNNPLPAVLLLWIILLTCPENSDIYFFAPFFFFPPLSHIHILIVCNVPYSYKDAIQTKLPIWHLGSIGKILNVVHPSLYPLIYGRGNGNDFSWRLYCKMRRRTNHSSPSTTRGSSPRRCFSYYHVLNFYSWNSQWLYGWYLWRALQVCCHNLGSKIFLTTSASRITSYINNFHPLKYKNLYRLVEQVINAAIPLWNMTLGHLDFLDWSNY